MKDVSSDLDGTGSAVVGGLEQVAAVKQGTGDSSLPTQMSSVRGLLSDLTIPSSRYDGLGNKGTVEQETKKAPKVQFDGDCAGQVFSPNLPFRSVFIAEDCCEGVDLMRSSGGASMDKQTGDWVGNLSIAHQVFDKLSNTPKPNEMSVSAAEKHPSMCKLKSEAIKKVSDVESAGGTEDVESSEEQMDSAEDGAEVRAFGKETKNGLRKEDVESGLTVSPKQDPLPDKGHSGDVWSKKPKESIAQDDRGKANEEVRAEAEATLPPLQIQAQAPTTHEALKTSPHLKITTDREYQRNPDEPAGNQLGPRGHTDQNKA
ncbi:hypothetical protein U1Q18_009896 [Sarracenia purpurea var. burkii]